jgi:hypothetical protein
MPRYVIERAFDPLDEELQEKIGEMSKKIIDERFPQIRWEHSHVVSDSEGNIKSFCVYEAPSEEVIRQHAKELGHHVIQHIYEIGADVNPRDIRSA